jgi:hypothetical protein
MKAGLLTFHHAHHYGAQLQAYALMKAVAAAGVDCEIINYVRSDTTEGNKLFKKGYSARALLSNANTVLNYGKLKKRYERFESFAHRDMKLSPKFYGTYGELEKDAPAYDFYVCGSDQIWNPLIYKEKTYDPAFFAAFARSGKKIAYAPSFGINEIPGDKREELKGYLDSFKCLSVREKQGEKIIRDIAGRESVTVLDPTLLLNGEEWDAHAADPAFGEPESGNPESGEPYILCYFISDAGKYSGFVGALSEKYGLPVVSLCGARRVVSQTKHTVLDAGPKEFLGLFKNAAAVCTDSFHGTVFSVNFKKEFYCFESAHKAEKAVNSRLYSILEKLGLVSRIFSPSMEADEFKKRIRTGEASERIDFREVDRLLDAERELSGRYLRNALQL